MFEERMFVVDGGWNICIKFISSRTRLARCRDVFSRSDSSARRDDGGDNSRAAAAAAAGVIQSHEDDDEHRSLDRPAHQCRPVDDPSPSCCCVCSER